MDSYIFFSNSFQHVVVPTRRGTEKAIQIFFSDLFGLAGSPFLIGKVNIVYDNIDYLSMFFILKSLHVT